MRSGALLAALALFAFIAWLMLRPLAPSPGIGDRCPVDIAEGRDGRGGFTPVPRPEPWSALLRARQPALDDWAEQCFYRAENARLKARGERAEVVLFGDSLIEGWRAGSPDFFTQGRINRGIGGNNTAKLLVRIGADVLALNPRVVHILVGYNDATGMGGPLREEDFARNLRALVRLARADGIAVILGTIPPGGEASWARGFDPLPAIRRMNDAMRRIAAEEGAQVVDYHAAMAGPDGRMRAGLTTDGIHPTPQGYAVMERVLAPALAAALR